MAVLFLVVSQPYRLLTYLTYPFFDTVDSNSTPISYVDMSIIFWSLVNELPGKDNLDLECWTFTGAGYEFMLSSSLPPNRGMSLHLCVHAGERDSGE